MGGWMIGRKVIGPSERPMRFSHPRQTASSAIRLPGWAPWNGTTAAYRSPIAHGAKYARSSAIVARYGRGERTSSRPSSGMVPSSIDQGLRDTSRPSPTASGPRATRSLRLVNTGRHRSSIKRGVPVRSPQLARSNHDQLGIPPQAHVARLSRSRSTVPLRFRAEDRIQQGRGPHPLVIVPGQVDGLIEGDRPPRRQPGAVGATEDCGERIVSQILPVADPDRLGELQSLGSNAFSVNSRQ